MFSRYNAMKPSKVKDRADDQLYPDPLSVNYVDTQMSTMPKRRSVSEADLRRFWIFMSKGYNGAAEGDDVLLTLNNIPYLGLLEPGEDLYLIDIADIYNFASQKKASSKSA